MNYSKKGYHLRISNWEGRLGNNIQQLCCALFIAEKTESILTYPDHNILTNEIFDFTTKDIDSKIDRDIINSTFFNYSQVCGQFLPLYNFIEQRRICENYISKLFGNVLNKNFIIEPNDSDLIIHIRSGDAFIGRSHPLYVEEPLSYYKTIIYKHYLQHSLMCEKFRIIIVTEPDLKNPCIKGVVNYVEYLNLLYAQYHILECMTDLIECIVDTDLITAIQLLLTAKNLVIANSSFSQRLTLCNIVVDNIYCSNLSIVEKHGTHNNESKIKYHFHKIANYIDFGEWKNTNEQMQLMLTHKDTSVCVSSDINLPPHFIKGVTLN